jgi:hypothetical protein
MGIEETEGEAKATRGKGRGSRFFVLGRAVWATLHDLPTANRLYLYLTFMVLLAGTGADHRLTKWSLKACDEHLGLGKPRSKRALEELISGGLIERVEGTSRLMPQYRLPDVSDDDDPIFLPVQLVTGFKGEASVLRRVRETGDALVLRMLVDLYGLVQVDATYGVPIENLRQGADDDAGVRKLAEAGVHALWALDLDRAEHARGDWCSAQHDKTRKGQEWAGFWERLRTLQKIGAIWFEPWLFESSALDAEPMFPVDFGVAYNGGDGDSTSELSILLMQIAEVMTAGREYLLENRGGDIAVPLPLHYQTPALRGVAKLRIEPDTPGCRLAYGKRVSLLADRKAAYERLLDDVASGRFDRPLGAAA